MAISYEHSGPHHRVAVWQLTETPEQLALLHPEGAARLAALCACHAHEQRRLEALAAAVLLYQLTGCEAPICHEPSGRPYLPDAPFAISLSHTVGWVALEVSQSMAPGVDVERIGRRVAHVFPRILTPADNVSTLSAQWSELDRATLVWCAKEAAFKALPGLTVMTEVALAAIDEERCLVQMRLARDEDGRGACTFRYHRLDDAWLLFRIA